MLSQRNIDTKYHSTKKKYPRALNICRRYTFETDSRQLSQALLEGLDVRCAAGGPGLTFEGEVLGLALLMKLARDHKTKCSRFYAADKWQDILQVLRTAPEDLQLYCTAKTTRQISKLM